MADEEMGETPESMITVENLDDTFDMTDSKHHLVLDYEVDTRRNVLDDFYSDCSSHHGDVEEDTPLAQQSKPT